MSDQLNNLNKGTGGFNIMDFALTNMIAQNISSTAGGFSHQVITMLIMLMMDELKKTFTEFVQFIKSNYKNMFWGCIYAITLLNPIHLIRELFKKKDKICIDTSDLSPKKKNLLITFKPSLNFMNSLIKYMELNADTCSYMISNKKEIEIKNFEHMEYSKYIENIAIAYKKIKILFSNDYKLMFKSEKGTESLIAFDGKPQIMDSDKVVYFTDILPKCDLTDYIKIQVSKNKSKIEGTKNVLVPDGSGGCTLGTSSLKKMDEYVSSNFFEDKFISLLKENFKNLDICIAYSEYIIFINYASQYMATLYNFFSRDLGRILTEKHQIILGGYKITCKSDIFSSCAKKYSYGYSLHDQYSCDETDQLKYASISKQDERDSTLQLTIVTENDESVDFHSKQFNEFINEINCFVQQKKSNKIKIYNINIIRTEVTKETPNPEYQAYTEKQKALESFSEKSDPNSKSDDGKSKYDPKAYMYAEFARMHVPPKTLIKYEQQSSVECTYVTEKSKDFETLYLREDDQNKLKGLLDSFKTKKELLDSLGLPNKLGVLLYGLPGTGKTSCIWTIATYLAKDIYYVNLSTVETNKELQMIFNYVTENVINGGILVFEDIDAMTNVVHCRVPAQNKQECNKLERGEEMLYQQDQPSSFNQPMYNQNFGNGQQYFNRNKQTLSQYIQHNKDQNKQDNKLTLEYFLNILQGTITQDGTMFIATTNHLEKLDPAFYRDGRFDIKIEMKNTNHHQIQQIYKKFFKRELAKELLDQIPEDKYAPAKIIFHIKDFIWGKYSDIEIVKKLMN